MLPLVEDDERLPGIGGGLCFGLFLISGFPELKDLQTARSRSEKSSEERKSPMFFIGWQPDRVS